MFKSFRPIHRKKTEPSTPRSLPPEASAVPSADVTPRSVASSIGPAAARQREQAAAESPEKSLNGDLVEEEQEEEVEVEVDDYVVDYEGYQPTPMRKTTKSLGGHNDSYEEYPSPKNKTPGVRRQILADDKLQQEELEDIGDFHTDLQVGKALTAEEVVLIRKHISYVNFLKGTVADLTVKLGVAKQDIEIWQDRFSGVIYRNLRQFDVTWVFKSWARYSARRKRVRFNMGRAENHSDTNIARKALHDWRLTVQRDIVDRIEEANQRLGEDNDEFMKERQLLENRLLTMLKGADEDLTLADVLDRQIRQWRRMRGKMLTNCLSYRRYQTMSRHFFGWKLCLSRHRTQAVEATLSTAMQDQNERMRQEVQELREKLLTSERDMEEELSLMEDSKMRIFGEREKYKAKLLSAHMRTKDTQRLAKVLISWKKVVIIGKQQSLAMMGDDIDEQLQVHTKQLRDLVAEKSESLLDTVFDRHNKQKFAMKVFMAWKTYLNVEKHEKLLKDRKELESEINENASKLSQLDEQLQVAQSTASTFEEKQAEAQMALEAKSKRLETINDAYLNMLTKASDDLLDKTEKKSLGAKLKGGTGNVLKKLGKSFGLTESPHAAQPQWADERYEDWPEDQWQDEEGNWHYYDDDYVDPQFEEDFTQFQTICVGLKMSLAARNKYCNEPIESLYEDFVVLGHPMDTWQEEVPKFVLSRAQSTFVEKEPNAADKVATKFKAGLSKLKGNPFQKLTRKVSTAKFATALMAQENSVSKESLSRRSSVQTAEI